MKRKHLECGSDGVFERVVDAFEMTFATQIRIFFIGSKSRLSLAPGFIPVSREEKEGNRFNGFLTQKLLKQFSLIVALDPALKCGTNERPRSARIKRNSAFASAIAGVERDLECGSLLPLSARELARAHLFLRLRSSRLSLIEGIEITTRALQWRTI